MTTNNYSIIFSSVTGNTKKLADTIHETLPQDMCDYFGGNDRNLICCISVFGRTKETQIIRH